MVRLTAAGNVAYYDERKVGAIKQAFAVELSVPTEKVRVSITAASVKIEVEITAVQSKQANDAIKAQLESKLSSPEAASSFLSTADLTVEVVDEVTVVEISAPTQDGLPTAAVIGIAVGVFVVLGLLGAGAATIRYHSKVSPVQVPLESKVRNLKVVTRAAAFCYPSTTTTTSTKSNTTPSHYGADHASASPDNLRVRTESGALSEGSLSRRLKTSRTPDRVAPVLRPAAQATQAAIWLQGKVEPAEAANAETPGDALEGSSIERHAPVLHELFAQPSGQMSRSPSSGRMSRSSRVLPRLPEESDAGSLRESCAARESRALARSPDRVAPVLRAGVRAPQAVIRMQREVGLAEAEAAARAAEAQAAKAKAKAEAMAELVVVAEVAKAEAEARVAEAEAEANTTPARAPPPPLNLLRMCAVHTPLKAAH